MSKSEHFPVANGGALVCNAPGCEYTAYIGEAAIERGASGETTLADYFEYLWRTHAHQFGPNGAPDITVEWELVASCSVCPEGGDMETDADGGVVCQTCFTSWNDRGEYGETDEDTLEEIRERDHEAALTHAAWLVAGRDREGNIRMGSGRSTLVGSAHVSRLSVEDWIESSRPGRYRDMYRAALDLLDREAAAGAPEEGVEAKTSAVEDVLSGAPTMRRFMDRIAKDLNPNFLQSALYGFDGDRVPRDLNDIKAAGIYAVPLPSVADVAFTGNPGGGTAPRLSPPFPASSFPTHQPIEPNTIAPPPRGVREILLGNMTPLEASAARVARAADRAERKRLGPDATEAILEEARKGYRLGHIEIVDPEAGK